MKLKDVQQVLEESYPDHVRFVHQSSKELGLELQEPDMWSNVERPEMVRQLRLVMRDA